MADIGLAWVNPAPFIKPENVINFAKKCEAVGCHSMWSVDFLGSDNLEPLTILAAAAGVTQRIRLGTSMLLGNLRHPSHLAKIISSLDFISNGRFTLGLGLGSRESDYKAVEIDYAHRGSREVEHVQLMKRLWTEKTVTHRGQFFNVENLSIGPRPVQKPHPPIWIGGSAEHALKRAGTWADGFICGNAAIPNFPATWEKIAGYAKIVGRDPSKIAKAGLTFMAIDDGQNKAVNTVENYVMRYYGIRFDVANTCLVGSSAAIVDRIGAFLSKGLDTLIIGVADPNPKQLDLFGEKVFSNLNH
jgi:probable F420-dependent oxidoreductase